VIRNINKKNKVRFFIGAKYVSAKNQPEFWEAEIPYI